VSRVRTPYRVLGVLFLANESVGGGTFFVSPVFIRECGDLGIDDSEKKLLILVQTMEK